MIRSCIHSLVQMGFVSSAYLGKDFKLLGVSLVRKNYLKVGVKSMVNFQHGEFCGHSITT